MKKISILVLLLGLSFIASACNIGAKREIQSFLSDITVDDILNSYESDDGTYSVFLSDTNALVYNTFSTEDKYFIVVREERSFAYLALDEEESDQDDKRRARHRYSFDRNTRILKRHDQDEASIVETLESDRLKDVVIAVKDHLDQPGDLLSFNVLFPIIKEVFSDITLSQMNVRGDRNHSIRRSYDPYDFLQEVPSFKAHLHTIYDPSTKDAIIKSMTTYNKRGSVHVKIRWVSEDQVIQPSFVIDMMHYQFYIINPFREHYDFD